MLHGWGRSDVLALAGVALAVIIAIAPPLRRMVARWWRGALLRAGRPRGKYARWFIHKRWGSYENPYLDDVENLDLRNTYVPLSFRTEGRPDELTIATTVLASPDTGNLIIDGGPGSGKSTLLKAYGVSLLDKRSAVGRGRRLVPFLVQLRKLASFLGEDKGIVDYLIREILVAGASMSADQARHFLEYTLRRGRAVVMLDGLDEVPAERYQAVLEAVFRFKGDSNPDCPTSQARLLLTCRRQNFLAVRDDWVPAFEARECSLAPLRNSEIFSYLDKLRRKFRPPNNPESYLQAVRASGTLELHRTPLILAMSVGLYTRKQFFEIPSSIAELYRTMIREMLDRHSFKRDPGGKALRFEVDDKYRFLREFSLRAAERLGHIGDFSKADLVAFARQLAPDLDASAVRDPDGMVEEILDRAGLLSDVGEKATWVFAHRSIQEFLAAEELRSQPDGHKRLLAKAGDHEWRQVAQFYCAGQEQRQIDDFLRELASRNPELAAYCLAGAKPSTAVAEAVLQALEPITEGNLPALAAATMSPRIPVQEMAITRLRVTLTARGSTLSVSHADVDGMLPLLNSLAGTNAAEIAALVPRISASLPDDPRLVEPLWRCLTASGIENLPEIGEIVTRLLKLVVALDCLEALASQDRYDREFLTGEVRKHAYPFDDGLPRVHNLVTLLAWAEHLRITLPPFNRFLEARAGGRLARVEADRKRTISFSLFLPARILSSTGFLACLALGVTETLTRPQKELMPIGWWTIPVYAVVGLAPFWLTQFHPFGNFEPTTTNMAKGSPKETRGNPGSANLILYWDDTFAADGLVGWIQGLAEFSCFFVAVPFSFTIAAVPIITTSWPGYVALAVGSQALFWATDMKLFNRGRRYFIFKPNEFVDMYDDPKSQHWLGLKSAPIAPAGPRTS